MHFKNKKYNFSMLVKKVRKLNLINSCDFKQLNNLSNAIFEEWSKIRNELRKKIVNKKIDEKIHAKFEAEEEMIVGLISLLNEKLINFIQH